VITDAIATIVEGHDLSADRMHAAMDAILAGEASEAQIAAFAVGLRMKGETPTEIAEAARTMRAHCTPVALDVQGPLLDTCGTGGDGLSTFNISTVSAIVAAAAGARVAKHGNRAMSSRSGSADVLEALGVRIDIEPERVGRCIREVGIGFMFAQTHHAALRHAGPVRRQIGVRTVFNLLGPLSNPASATHQLMGVYDGARVEQMAEALGLLGVEAAWVVHGEGGMDEVSPTGSTRVAQLAGGRVTVTELRPEDFGVEPVSMDALAGGDAAVNAAIARRVLAGEPGAPRTAVLVNAGAALCVVGLAGSPRDGARQAAEAIDSGAAREKLEAWCTLTREP